MSIAEQRLGNQRLIGAGLESPKDVVRWLGAVQSQDYHGAKWALAQRLAGFEQPTGTPGIDDAALDRIFDEGSIIRTHVMRPTWHFVAPEDIRWLLQLTGPRVHAVNSHYSRKLELDEPTLRRGHQILERSLQGNRYRTRKELQAVLADGGIEASGQRLAYLVMHAELWGLICSGPRRGKQFTYALLEERAAPVPPLSRDEALAELTRRYFRSHGPALVKDFCWWSGLTVADAKRGIESIRGDLESQLIGSKTYWAGDAATVQALSAADAGATGRSPKSARFSSGGSRLHLLPNYDEHVVAYRDHNPTLHADAIKDLASDALFLHLIALDGLIIGGWRRTVQREWVDLSVESGIALENDERGLLDEAVGRYERFIGLPVRLAVSKREEGDSQEC